MADDSGRSLAYHFARVCMEIHGLTQFCQLSHAASFWAPRWSTIPVVLSPVILPARVENSMVVDSLPNFFMLPTSGHSDGR